jgi:hypothetical protein
VRTNQVDTSVHVEVPQVFTSLQVQIILSPVQAIAHVLISHDPIVLSVQISLQVQTSHVPINVDKYVSASSNSIFVSQDVR